MGRLASARAAIAAWPGHAVRSPMAWIILATFVLHIVGVGWGLPSSDGWDDDGIAPRDFLVGTYLTYQPGEYFTYPPVHLLLLSILTLPATVIGLAKSASLAPSDVVAELTHVPYMTFFSLMARLVSEAMALGIVFVVARIGEEIWGRRAGVWAAAVVGLNMTFTYYAHTSNLDVPYLFWTLLAMLVLVRAIVRHEPKRLRRFALLAVLAVGTKDQAYAVILLSYPLVAVAWLTLDPWGRSNRRAVLREVALSLVGGAALLLLVDGAVVNPSGFAARIRFLTGSASQDHAYYVASWAGRMRVLYDGARYFVRYYPIALAPFVLYGVALHFVKTRGDRARAIAGVIPLLGILSFTIAFNWVARRTEHRFLLPQYLLVAFYAGVALDAATRSAWRGRALGWAASVVIGAFALFNCVAVDVALVKDSRYDAEAWLKEHVAPGDLVEVYGNNVYLPRLPRNAHIARVDPSPVAGRSPMPGVEEIDQRFELVEERRPTWIIMSDGWAWRYTQPTPDTAGGAGQIAPGQVERQNDVAARAYFASLFFGTGSYFMAHDARYDDRFWPRIDIHSSTTRSIHIFRRKER